MNITINGKICEAQYGEFILEIAKRNNIDIPTLCHSEALPGQGNCRLCIVDIVDNGAHKTVTSCVYPVTREIEIITNSEKIINMRKIIIKLLSARVPNNEYIKKLKAEYGIADTNRFTVDVKEECIMCGLCVRACEAVGPCAISTVNRGIDKKISTPYEEPSLGCIGCGACASVCPTGAIKTDENNRQRIIWNKKFELLSCEECGKYFITCEEMEYIKTKLNFETEECLCDKCRKSIIAKSLKDIYAK